MFCNVRKIVISLIYIKSILKKIPYIENPTSHIIIYAIRAHSYQLKLYQW